MLKSIISLALLLGIPDWSSAEPPEMTIKDVDGKKHTLWQGEKTKAVVFVFVSTDCPIANFYQPSLRRLAGKYTGKGVSFFQIHPDPEVPLKDVRKHIRDFKITVPVAIDRDQKLTKTLKAGTTPEVFVLTPDGKPVYRGRIDNSYTTFGKRRPQPTKHDLREALDAVLAGRKVAVPVTDPVGCRIFIE